MLLAEEQRVFFRNALQKSGTSALQKKGIFKKVQEKCKKTVRCIKCDEVNGMFP